MGKASKREWSEYSYEEFKYWIESNQLNQRSLFKEILPLIQQIGSAKIKEFEGNDLFIKKGAPSTKELYLLLEGNAILVDTYENYENLDRYTKLALEAGRSDLRGIGDIHPFFLCPGDMIGEYEIQESEPYMVNVILGLPFAIGSSRGRDKTIIMKFPINQFTNDPSFRELINVRRNAKILSVQQMLSAKCQPNLNDQLAYIIWLCIQGHLPVLQPKNNTSDKLIFNTSLTRLVPDNNWPKNIYLPQKYLEILIHPTRLKSAINDFREKYDKHKENIQQEPIIPTPIERSESGTPVLIYKFSVNSKKTIEYIWQMLRIKFLVRRKTKKSKTSPAG